MMGLLANKPPSIKVYPASSNGRQHALERRTVVAIREELS